MENVIEIVSNLFSNGLLLKSGFKNDNIILLDMHLDMGNLKDLKNYRRSFLKNIGYNSDEIDYSEYSYLIERLINKDKIKVVENCEDLFDCVIKAGD